MNVAPGIEVDAEDAERVKNLLLKNGLLDDTRRIRREGKKVIIPVKTNNCLKLKPRDVN